MREGRPEREHAARFLQHRDEASFLALYRPQTPVLLRIALRLLGGRRADAEDAVQETWLRATPRLSEWRGESAFGTWLAGFTINICRERLRRREEREDAPAGPEMAGGAAEPPLDLERAIEALPDGAREVLVLFDLMGYTHEEIGRHLGIAEGTSKSQLSRARKELRRRMGASPAPAGRLTWTETEDA